MRILHTADIHLRAGDDDAERALRAVVAAAREHADLLTVGGDLVDRAGRPAEVAGTLRGAFDELDAPVVVLPGNHDPAEAYDGVCLGEDVFVFGNEPCWRRTVGGLPLTGVPYRDSLEELLRGELPSPPDAPAVLLLHCALVAGPDSGAKAPVPLEALEDIEYDYVLAGHVHDGLEVLPTEGGVFIYPGRPASPGGPRQAPLIDTDRGSVVPVDLPS